MPHSLVLQVVRMPSEIALFPFITSVTVAFFKYFSHKVKELHPFRIKYSFSFFPLSLDLLMDTGNKSGLPIFSHWFDTGSIQAAYLPTSFHLMLARRACWDWVMGSGHGWWPFLVAKPQQVITCNGMGLQPVLFCTYSEQSWFNLHAFLTQ